MAHYIVTYGSASVHKGKSIRTERIYEYLFGEVVTVIEEGSEWMLINTPFSEVSGWIQAESITPITDKQYNDYCANVKMRVECNSLFVKKVDSYDTIVVPAMSVLPFYNFMTNTFSIADTEYEILSPIYWDSNVVDARTRVYRAAMCYLNAPFARNRRSVEGIDDVNLVANALSVINETVPRSIEMLSSSGIFLSFIEEAQLGDILLFSNSSSGEVSHCGMSLGNGRVLHASGKVRIDRVDHQGIFNPTLKRYSFHLVGILAIE